MLRLFFCIGLSFLLIRHGEDTEMANTAEVDDGKDEDYVSVDVLGLTEAIPFIEE